MWGKTTISNLSEMVNGEILVDKDDSENALIDRYTKKRKGF